MDHFDSIQIKKKFFFHFLKDRKNYKLKNSTWILIVQ